MTTLIIQTEPSNPPLHLLQNATKREDRVFDKFLSLLGRLCGNVNPYSNRFMAYWLKTPPKTHRNKVVIARSKRGTVSFSDAWKLLTAYFFATNSPYSWRDDIPALVSHRLNGESDVSGMLDEETASLWHSILSDFSRSEDGSYRNIRPRNSFPLHLRK